MIENDDDKVVSIKSVKGKPTLAYESKDEIEVDERLLRVLDDINQLINDGKVHGIAVTLTTTNGEVQRAVYKGSTCDSLAFLAASTLLHDAVLEQIKSEQYRA